MSKRWIVLLGILLVSFAIGCGEEAKVKKPDKIPPPPPDGALQTQDSGDSGGAALR